jgi:CMP-N-acetylneuraminic acid synthetase
MKTPILAVIPARGGSKGIPKKNLQEIKERTLVSWAITVANSVSGISHSAVSTDSEEIAHESLQSGVTSVVKRPEILSGDTVLDQPVLLHAMLEIETNLQMQFDFVIMLQPTSPIRKKEDIENAIKLIKENKYDSIWSISQEELHHHPQK